MISRRFIAAVAAALSLFPAGVMASDTDRQESSGIVPALQDGLRGVVTDMVTGEPLIGAGILIEGTTEGTVTDVDGSYVLALPEGTHSLSVSYIGYLTVNLTVTVNPDGTGTVRASEDTSISMTDSGLSPDSPSRTWGPGR